MDSSAAIGAYHISAMNSSANSSTSLAMAAIGFSTPTTYVSVTTLILRVSSAELLRLMYPSPRL